jgi:iron complex outermembrane receptor protein
MVGAAARLENYSDFGRTLNGKLSFRLAFSGQLAVRGSVSTGFRAPFAGPAFFKTTFTNFVPGVPVDQVITRNNSPLTRKLGIPALSQEKAVNASLGLTGSFRNFTATVDGYEPSVTLLNQGQLNHLVPVGSFEDQQVKVGTQVSQV